MLKIRRGKQLAVTLFAAVALLLTSLTLHAAPFFTDVDLDPVMPGIQGTLTVSLGSTFTVLVVIGETSPPPLGSPFDTVYLDVLFNDAGPVLGLAPGPVPGLPSAGVLAAMGGAPPVIDYVSGAPIVPGGLMTTGPSGALGPPFTSGLGGVGLYDPSAFPGFPVGGPVDVFGVTFTALAPGTSTVFVPGAFPGTGDIFIGGTPGTFPPTGTPVGGAGSTFYFSGVVTVIPLPTAWLLFSSAVFGVGLMRRKISA